MQIMEITLHTSTAIVICVEHLQPLKFKKVRTMCCRSGGLVIVQLIMI